MDMIQEAIKLFGSTPKPEHFTNYKHCCECAEHDETLRKETLESLSFEHLHPAWDPLCFINAEGFQYFFPALVRLTLQGTGENYFIGQIIFHLEYDGDNNSRYLQFSKEQRRYVVKLLKQLIETRAQEIEDNHDSDALFRAIEIWDRDSVA